MNRKKVRSCAMEPLRLASVCKDYIWGGDRLRREFGKCSGCERIAESWELACREDGENRVVGGSFDGLTLSQALEQLGKEALGARGARFPFFPVLIKLIDAKENLSVQVHPDDAFALREEGEYGKNELWYVVDCAPGASLYYGFESQISREEFAARIEEGTLEKALHRVTVKKGDTFFIEAGTIHAIGAGILVAEIQQNSNVTYRVYDYGRKGADGKPRQLHVEKALRVAKLGPAPSTPPVLKRPASGGAVSLLADCPYFATELLALRGKMARDCTLESFAHLLVLSGNGRLSWSGGELPFQKGDSLFLPAGLGCCTLEGEGELLSTGV